MRPTIDLDPTDVEVYGTKKEGVAFNHQGQRFGRPHPAIWAEAGVVLAADLGSGTSDPRPQAPSLVTRAVAALPEGLLRPIIWCDSGFFFDREEIASGEALAGIVRPGNAGSNTAADHVSVLEMAIESLPDHAQPQKDDLDSPRFLVRSDSAGATHLFAQACIEAGVGFSFGFPITAEVREAVGALSRRSWHKAVEVDESVRDGAFVAQITRLLDLRLPKGSRVIVRKERPHPGAQLSLFDTDAGYRHTAFVCCPRSECGRDTSPVAILEIRHRRHARVEDRIRQAKALNRLVSIFGQELGLRPALCRACVIGKALPGSSSGGAEEVSDLGPGTPLVPGKRDGLRELCLGLGDEAREQMDLGGAVAGPLERQA